MYRQKKLQKYVAAKTTQPLALVLATAMLTTSCQGLQRPHFQIQEACDAASYLRQLSTQAISATESSLRSAISELKSALALQVLAAKATGANRLAANILAASRQSTATAKLTALADKLTAIGEGLVGTGVLAGAQEIVAELTTLTVQDANLDTATTYTTTATPLKVTPKLSPNVNGMCMESAEKRKEPQAAKTPRPEQPTIKLFTVAAETPGSQTGDKLTLCGHGANTGAITGPSSCATGQTTTIGLRGGAILKATQVTTTAQQTPTGTQAYSKVGGAESVPSQASLTAELAKILLMETNTVAIERNQAVTELVDIASSSSLKDLLAKTLDGESATYNNPETKPKVDAFLKDLFGDKAENVKTTIEKDLKGLVPPKAAIGGNGDKKLETINDPKELADAQIYYTVKKFVDEQEQKKKNIAGSSCPAKTDKPEEPKKTADECKKHTTEKPCREETGCDFDDKKPEGEGCFPKEN